MITERYEAHFFVVVTGKTMHLDLWEELDRDQGGGGHVGRNFQKER